MIQEIFRIDIDLLALASRLKIMKKGFKNFFGLGVSAFHSHTPHFKILKVVVGNTVFILLKCFCFVFAICFFDSMMHFWLFPLSICILTLKLHFSYIYFYKGRLLKCGIFVLNYTTSWKMEIFSLYSSRTYSVLILLLILHPKQKFEVLERKCSNRFTQCFFYLYTCCILL